MPLGPDKRHRGLGEGRNVPLNVRTEQLSKRAYSQSDENIDTCRPLRRKLCLVISQRLVSFDATLISTFMPDVRSQLAL